MNIRQVQCGNVHRTGPAHRCARQRGMATLLVLGTVAIATILAVTFLARQSTSLAVTSNLREHTNARYIAESGLVMADAYIRQTTTWRHDLHEGPWIDEHPYAGGTFSIEVYDGVDEDGDGVIDGDGDITDDQTDPITLIAVGRFGASSYTVRAEVVPGSTVAKTVLLIVPDAHNISDQDATKRDLMEGWGFHVRVLSGNVSQLTYEAAVADADVVFVSENVLSINTDRKLRDVPIGVVNEEQALTDELGFSSRNGGYSSDRIWIDDNTHYITSQFKTGELVISSRPAALHDSSGSYAEGARILARRSRSGQAVLIAIEAGQPLYDGGTAQARRVHLPWGTNDFDINRLSANGLIIMRRALEWAAQPITPAPAVSQWPMDDMGGQTVRDAVNNHHGSYRENPTLLSEGVFGTAVDFDGYNDYVLVPHHEDYQSTEGAVSFWFRPNSLQGTQGLVSKDSKNYDDGGHLLITTEHSRVEVRLQSTDHSYTLRSGNVLEIGRWYHAAVTFGESGMTLYLNGEPVDSNSYTGGLVNRSGRGNHEPWVFAADSSYSNDEAHQPLSNFFNGRLDDVRFYNYSLSGAEVASLHQEGVDQDGDVPQLVSRYEFDEVIHQPTLTHHWPLDEAADTAEVLDIEGDLVGSVTGADLGSEGHPSADGQEPPTGTSAYLDGNHDWIEIDHDPRLALDQGTISLWFCNDLQWQLTNIMGKQNSGYNTYEGDFSVHLLLDRLFIKLASSNRLYQLNTSSLDANEWYHLAFTFGPGGMKLYMNGALVDSNDYTGGLAENDHPIQIGQYQLVFLTTFFKGWLDELRFFDRALDSGQVDDLYHDRTLRPSPGPGSLVVDSAGYMPHVDMSIQDTSAIGWIAEGGLNVNEDVTIASTESAAKIRQAINSTNAMTLSVVFSTDDMSQYGPAQIVSYSHSSGHRNFNLTQDGQNYQFKLQTTSSGSSGTAFASPVPLSSGNRQHIIVTCDGEKVELWRNSVLETSYEYSGDFSNWDADAAMQLANELNSNRDWHGTLYHVAIYDQALNAFQIEDVFRGDSPRDYSNADNIVYSLRWLEGDF